MKGGYMPPIVLGHPKHDAPRVGSVVDVKEEGGAAWYKVDHLTPEFHESCQKGEYLFGSPWIKSDGSMRHLGALGAWEPAMLEQPAWALGAPPADMQIEDEDLVFGVPADWGSVTASWLQRLAWRLNSLGRLFQAQREAVIADKGIEEADKRWPAWGIDNLKDFKVPDTIAPSSSETGSSVALGSPEGGAGLPAPASSAEADTLRTQLEEANRKLREREMTDLGAAFGAALDQAANEGRLNLPMREKLEELHKELTSAEGLAFGSADPVPTALASLVAVLPKIVDLGELALGSPETVTPTNPLIENAQRRAQAAKENR